MNRKIAIQIFLFLFFLISIFFFYYTYFYKSEKKIAPVSEIDNPSEFQSENNIIKDIEYFSVDEKGNEYLIISEYGEMTENSNLIKMKNVKATINLLNREKITISSDFAKYNNKNFDTNFKKNVVLKYLDNKVIADNIDLSLEEKIAETYNNVIYTNPTKELFADRIEIDLITKNSKILMNNGKKIKIIGK